MHGEVIIIPGKLWGTKFSIYGGNYESEMGKVIHTTLLLRNLTRRVMKGVLIPVSQAKSPGSRTCQ